MGGRTSVIRLAHVSKMYGEGVARTTVLRDVSLTIGAGEFVALVGPSGSGKSTLLNIVGGLDSYDSGEVEVLGHDCRAIRESRLAALRNRDIGFVFQSFHLLDHLTVRENVLLPAAFGPNDRSAPAKAETALERVGLAALMHRKPTELSGGQKQRVAIARALFNAPKILLCDEPTGNLDSETGHTVVSFFRELNRNDNVTLLVVTHEQWVAENCTRVVHIKDGAIVSDSGSGAARDGDARAQGLPTKD